MENKMIGLWSIDGRKIIQTDTTWRETFANEHRMFYEFRRNGTVDTGDENLASWKFRNDSLIIIASTGPERLYSIHVKNDSIITLTEKTTIARFEYEFRKEK